MFVQQQAYLDLKPRVHSARLTSGQRLCVLRGGGPEPGLALRRPHGVWAPCSGFSLVAVVLLSRASWAVAARLYR